MSGSSPEALPPVDVRPLFAPLLGELLELLRGLTSEEWERPASRSWTVRDVAAHLLDGDCRQLTFARDRLPLLPPERPIHGPDGFLAFLDELNAVWVKAAKRLSPALLVDLLGHTGAQVAEFFAGQDPEDEAIFAVAWAGESVSRNWMHLARELTERWHHQQQIRAAAGRPLLGDPRFSRPVLEAFLRGVPPAYANVSAPAGASIAVRFGPPVDRQYALVRTAAAWQVAPAMSGCDATIAMDPESGWLALTRSIPRAEARSRAEVSGPEHLVAPFFDACSIHKRPVEG